MKRLEKFSIPYQQPQERLDDEAFIYFEDLDGLGIELVSNKTDLRKGFTYGQIPLEHAVKGFYGVTLSEEGYERTAGLLTEKNGSQLNYRKRKPFSFFCIGQAGRFCGYFVYTR